MYFQKLFRFFLLLHTRSRRRKNTQRCLERKQGKKTTIHNSLSNINDKTEYTVLLPRHVCNARFLHEDFLLKLL